MIRRSGGAAVAPQPLTEWQASCTVGLTLELHMVPAGSINIRCALFQCMLNGRLVLWDILRIFGTLRMQSQGGRAGKWASHGWAAWERLLQAVGLNPEAHLLTRFVVVVVGGGGDVASCAVGKAVGEDGWSSEWRAASTVALVALLSKWSSHDKKTSMGNDYDRSAVACLLLSLCDAAFPPGFECAWEAFLSGQAEWQPPHLPVRRWRCEVLVRGGRLFLHQLFSDWRATETGAAMKEVLPHAMLPQDLQRMQAWGRGVGRCCTQVGKRSG